MSIAIVIPTHNDERIIEAVVGDLLKNINSRGIAKILLVENGSRDQTAALCERLAARFSEKVTAMSIPQAGIGHAYYAGIKYANENLKDLVDWVLLSASDLPFGYSDLESFQKNTQAGSESRVFIGSKAHPESVIQRSFKRNLVSFIFRLLRRLCLGINVGDTQGTFLLPKGTWEQCLKTRARDFFFTTEMTYNLMRAGHQVMEIPVELRPEIRISTVRPFRHGYSLLRQMILLRWQ